VAIFTKEDRQSVEGLFYSKLAKYDYTKRDDSLLELLSGWLRVNVYFHSISRFVFLKENGNNACMTQ
jgi:hypothetical protein